MADGGILEFVHVLSRCLDLISGCEHMLLVSLCRRSLLELNMADAALECRVQILSSKDLNGCHGRVDPPDGINLDAGLVPALLCPCCQRHHHR